MTDLGLTKKHEKYVVKHISIRLFITLFKF